MVSKVIKIDSTGTIAVIAGTGTEGYSGDGGPATAAELGSPAAVTTDSLGNVFIADVGNNRIRKITIATGIITTIAGNGTGSFSGDGGPAISAELYAPDGLYFDNYGNLFVTDANNNRIRKIDTSGIITTIVGNGTAGSSGDGGMANAAECEPVFNVCIDAVSNLYFIDNKNATIRKVNTSGVISTIAGNSTGMWAYAGDEVPALGAPMAPLALAFDKNGLLTIADGENERIRRIDNSGIIHTIAGNGTQGDSGDGGSADSAELYTPSGIAYDTCGNLYISQVDEPRIRKVSFNPACWPERVPQIIKTDVTIYPNPAYETINIDNVTTQTNYEVINITGIIEQSGALKAGNNSIAVQALPMGVHLLQITDNEGRKTITKIIKQ